MNEATLMIRVDDSTYAIIRGTEVDDAHVAYVIKQVDPDDVDVDENEAEEPVATWLWAEVEQMSTKALVARVTQVVRQGG